MSYELTKENHTDLEQALEYITAQWCNENKISGELAWLLIHNMSEAKLKTFQSNRL